GGGTGHGWGGRIGPPRPPIRSNPRFGWLSGLPSAQPATASKPAAVAPARIEAHTGNRFVEHMGRNPFRGDPVRLSPAIEPTARGAPWGLVPEPRRVRADRQPQPGSRRAPRRPRPPTSPTARSPGHSAG